MKFFWMLARSNGYKWLYSDFDARAMIPTALPAKHHRQRQALRRASIEKRATHYKEQDCGIAIASAESFRYRFHSADRCSDGDARWTIPTLCSRYWTVFEPDAFRFDGQRLSRSPLKFLRAASRRALKRLGHG